MVLINLIADILDVVISGIREPNLPPSANEHAPAYSPRKTAVGSASTKSMQSSSLLCPSAMPRGYVNGCALAELPVHVKVKTKVETAIETENSGKLAFRSTINP